MLISVQEEPLVEFVGPAEVGWTSRQKRVSEMLAGVRDSLAPDARTVVQPDVLVWRALRHVVRQEHRDLLVVGSSHDADKGHVRLGRNTTELLGHLECPLAIAPSGQRDSGREQLERIGVGLDGGPESRAALSLAASIAAAAGAELDVRGAVDDGVAGGLRTEQIVLEGNAITAAQLSAAFERDLDATRATGVPAQVEVEVGMATDVLSELADGVDLLVIGSGHSAAPGRLQLGDTGRALLHYAPCPVLVVPRPAKPSERPGHASAI